MDSRATHHFTPEFGQLQDPSTYCGDAQAMVGNGKHIDISHIGHVLISTPVRPIKLQNVLHTPEISKQLISVTKLCADDKAFVKFFPTYFLVNDQMSKKVLLQGNLENGLYKLSLVASSTSNSSNPPPSTCSSSAVSNPAQAFLTQFNNAILWHNRLGHPASRIVSQVIKMCNLKPLNLFHFCFAC